MISSKPARAAATATSTLYFQTRRSYGFVQPSPAASRQTEPSDAADREIRPRAREHGILEHDDAADEVDARARAHERATSRGVVVVARRADRRGERNASAARSRSRRSRPSRRARAPSSPSRSRSRYSSSLPGSDASAIVTWTPRSSIGSVRGPLAGVAASVARSATVGWPSLVPDERAPTPRSSDARRRNAPDGSAPPQALPPPYRRPTLAKPLVRVDGWEQHRHRGVDLIAALVESPRGPLRSHDPAPPRRGPNRHRSVRAGADAAVEPRRARRPLLPRLPQLPLPVHRRQGASRRT